MTTNVPPIVFSATGAAAPSESSVLAGVFADLKAALGSDMSTSLSSPQGQLAQSLTAIIGDKNNDILAMSNQINPDTADGRWQDALGRIYFMDRIAASGTLVTGTCSGLAGTVIPAGTLAQATTGEQYASLVTATIGATGTVNVDFQAIVPGPTACPIGALSKIFKAISGWDSVTNATAGTPGVLVENRNDFEFRRANSVAANAIGSVPAIRAAVLAVPNVLDAYVAENATNATVNTGATNYPMIANSVYIAVAGGDPVAIATAIWNKKSSGSSYNGTTTQNITDTSGGVIPYPNYTIKWVTPTAVPIYFAVSISNNTALPSNIATLVQQAILAAFNGTDGGLRARIGSTLVSGRYYAGINAISPIVEILSITLGTTASPTGLSLAMGIDQRPTLDVTNIALTLV